MTFFDLWLVKPKYKVRSDKSENKRVFKNVPSDSRVKHVTRVKSHFRRMSRCFVIHIKGHGLADLQQVTTNAPRPQSDEPTCSVASVIGLLCITLHVVSTLTQTSTQTGTGSVYKLNANHLVLILLSTSCNCSHAV